MPDLCLALTQPSSTLHYQLLPIRQVMGIAHYVSQPPLPKMSGRSSDGLAGGAQGRSAAGRLFPRRFHAARRDWPDRLPEQGGGLRPVVPHGCRDAADYCRRSQTPRRPHRRHCRAPQLGRDDDPPSACPHDRAGCGISLDGTRWVRCKPGFLLPVQVLSRLFRRLFLAALADAHAAGRLAFFGAIGDLRCRKAFDAHLAPLKRKNWFVYTKAPFAGPEAVLAYLARYTHRVAIANSRLVALDERGVTFRYKDYRRSGPARYCTMTLPPDEFIRRFLMHVLPKGFHRIRHYGLLASASCKANIARARQLMAAPMAEVEPPAVRDTADPDATTDHRPPCPCCGGRMIIVEVFARGAAPRGPPSGAGTST